MPQGPTGFADPTQRVETWLFVDIGRTGGPDSQPVYRCLPYVLVQYDGDPQQYLEPSPADEAYALISGDVSATGLLSHRRVNPPPMASDASGSCGF